MVQFGEILKSLQVNSVTRQVIFNISSWRQKSTISENPKKLHDSYENWDYNEKKCLCRDNATDVDERNFQDILSRNRLALINSTNATNKLHT